MEPERVCVCVCVYVCSRRIDQKRIDRRAFFNRRQISRALRADSGRAHSITDRISGSETSFYIPPYTPPRPPTLPLILFHSIRKKNGLSGARTFSSCWNLRDGTKANYATRRVRGLSGSHKEFLPMRHPPTPSRRGLRRRTPSPPSLDPCAVWRVFKTVGLCASGTVIWPLIKTLCSYVKLATGRALFPAAPRRRVIACQRITRGKWNGRFTLPSWTRSTRNHLENFHGAMKERHNASDLVFFFMTSS